MSTEEFEYEGDLAVFVINDGERHWYVAEDTERALVAHIALMEPEGDEFTVTKLAPSAPVTLYLEDRADARRFPEAFERIDPADDESWYRVRASAAMWAAFQKAGDQICSSCFA